MGSQNEGKAQETEFGIWAGTANYFGDLNPVFSFKELRWAGGMFYRRNFNTRMSVKAGLNYSRIAASDSKIKKVPYPQIRNLSFESDIIEFTGTYEFNFLKYEPTKNKNFTPYIFVGVSVFYYNPFTRFDGNREYLQVLGTEGQNTPFGEDNRYSRYSFAIPFGGGLRYALSENWGLNLEISSRRTFTDYIDDVSNAYIDPDILGGITAPIADQSGVDIPPEKQRGTARDLDRFNYYGIAVTYTIITTKCPPIIHKGF